MKHFEDHLLSRSVILFFLLFSFSSPAEYIGLSGQAAPGSRAFVEQDILPGKRGTAVITHVKDYRGRSCCSWKKIPLYSEDHPFFKGEQLVLGPRGWEKTGTFQNETQKIRMRIILWAECRLEIVPESEALLKALLLGRVSTDTAKQFRKCGLSFLLALSGMHIALIIELLNYLLIIYLPKGSQRPVTAVLLLLFLWITGIRHSLVRAFLMFLFRAFHEIRGRPFQSWQLLSFCALVHLMIFPRALYSLSYQLSYLAVVGILYFTPLIRLLIPRQIPGILSEALSLSLGAQCAVNPLLIMVFGEIHPMSLLSVLFLAPLITMLLWLGLLYLPSGFCPGMGGLLEFLLRQLGLAVDMLAGFFSQFPPLGAGKGGDKTLLWLSLIPPLVFAGYYVYQGVLRFGKKARPELRFADGN